MVMKKPRQPVTMQNGLCGQIAPTGREINLTLHGAKTLASQRRIGKPHLCENSTSASSSPKTVDMTKPTMTKFWLRSR